MATQAPPMFTATPALQQRAPLSAAVTTAGGAGASLGSPSTTASEPQRAPLSLMPATEATPSAPSKQVA
eukprot:2657390-Alexandrium_andersonii.AAC.1